MHKNLHLALLDNLMDAGLLPRFDRDAFFTEHRGEPFDPNSDYDFKPLLDVEAFLLGIELRDADLAQLEDVSIDPGQRLQQDMYPQWSGENRYFDVPSLEGLQRCTSAKSLWLELLTTDAPADIEALRHMPRLEKISFDGSQLDDITPLAAIPALRRLEFVVTSVKDTPENQAALVKLRRMECAIVNKLPRGMTF